MREGSTITESGAIRFAAYGGPEVLQWEKGALPAPAADEVQFRNRAIGVKFIDIYHRTGLYPVALPSGLGQEGVGEVVDAFYLYRRAGKPGGDGRVALSCLG